MFEFPLSDGLKTRVSAYADGIFRVQTGGYDGFPQSVLERYGFIESLPPHPQARCDGRTILAGELSLDVLADGNIAFSRDGEVLVHSLPGTVPATFPTIHGNRGWRMNLSLAGDEKLIGFGDQVRTSFLLNGTCDQLWLKYPLKHVPVPCFFSSRGYGILFNTTRRLRYDIGVQDAGCSSFRVENEFLDYWIFAGDVFDGLIERYTRITGRPSLPPMKSFGLWLLMHTQASGHDVLSVATRMRDAGIPCDNIGLEPGWMETRYDYSADKDWNAARFRGTPHPEAYRAGPPELIKALSNQGYATGLWLCSRWDYTWEEERQLGVRSVEEAKPEASLKGIEINHPDENVGHAEVWMDEITRRDEPWFAHLQKFVEEGVRFFKIDPALLINEWPDRLYGNGRRDDEMHNIAFMLCSKQMTAGYEAMTGQRSYGLSVAGWAGFQRFAGTWAGDTGGGTQSLVGILQDAVMGHSCATCDMDTTRPAGLHMGYLLPWALLNSWAYFSYPGCQGEKIDAMHRFYSRLRMRLLPYLYSLAWQSIAAGKAIARPMFLIWPQRDEAYAQFTQFMFGDSLLVGCGTDVVLPAGRWFNWWDSRVITGNWDSHALTLPTDRGGYLLVREGGLLPLGPEMMHVDELSLSSMTWIYFPSNARSAFTLYRDAGDGLGFKDGDCAVATLIATPTPDGVDIQWSKIDGNEPHRIASLTHVIEILGVTDCEASTAAGPLCVVRDEAGNRCRLAAVSADTSVRIRWKVAKN